MQWPNENGFDFCLCLTPLSTIFQLYHVDAKMDKKNTSHENVIFSNINHTQDESGHMRSSKAVTMASVMLLLNDTSII